MAEQTPWVNDRNAALLVDLYELTMLQSYWKDKLNAEAVFSLFVRKLPPERNYLLACGLSDALRYLEKLRFTSEAINYLNTFHQFTDEFLQRLADFHFTGDVYAVPEGTPVFSNEPLLEVVAPLPEAQLAETFIMNQVHLQTVLASKAARVVRAAKGRAVVDFGLRRMHGTDAGLKAARAFHIAGITATSNVLAGSIYGIPVAGTMRMGVSTDAPALDIAYKLVEYAGRGRIKLSPGKLLLPGRKQIFRIEENGRAIRDVIACHHEDHSGRPLLQKVMENGRSLSADHDDLNRARTRAKEEIGRLPERVQEITPADPPYAVLISDSLKAYQAEVVKRTTNR